MEAGDLRIVNTCSVTAVAGRKSRQWVRRQVRLPVLGDLEDEEGFRGLDITEGQEGAFSGRRPRVVVTGCWATSDREAAERMPGVDAVLGHDVDAVKELDALVDGGMEGSGGGGGVENRGGRTALPVLGERQEHQRAFLKIQDGCDAHCTYCIIPQVRPELRSRSPDDIEDEVRRLISRSLGTDTLQVAA